MVQLKFEKEYISLIPENILEIVFVEKVLKLLEDGDIAVCYRKDKEGGSGEMEKIIIESQKKLKMKAKPATAREKAIINSKPIIEAAEASMSNVVIEAGMGDDQ